MAFAVVKSDMTGKAFAFHLRALILAWMLIVGWGPAALADSSSFLLPSAIRQWLIWETQHNPMATQKNEGVALTAIHVPLHLIEAQLLDSFTAEMKAALFITDAKGNNSYRWIFHPDDHFYRDQVIEFIKGQTGQEPVIETKFIGFKTASRSFVVFDPVSGMSFSLKTSTKQAAGVWIDKAQPVRYAESAVLANQHLAAVEKEFGPMDHAVAMKEPGAVLMRGIDQAQIFRSLEGLKSGERLHLPLFSVLSRPVMRRLTTANNMDPGQVVERVGEMWGQAQAEFILKTGLSVSSAHSQNFLVELDANHRFTGRIVFRDFADSHLMSEFVRGPYRDRLINHWTVLRDMANGVFKRTLSGSFLPYHMLDIETNDLTARIYKGTDRGFRRVMTRMLGPWGFQQWELKENMRKDATAVMYLMTPKEGVNIDVDQVAELVQSRMSVFSCRRVHGR